MPGGAEGTYIQFQFRERSLSGKTVIYDVEEKRGIRLGEIRWFAVWRRYAFYPQPCTVFEEKCLGEIAEFCANLTKS